MADQLIKSSAGVALTPAGGGTVTNGQIVSTEAVVIVADDTTSHEDLIEVSVKIDAGTDGAAISVTLAEGNTAGEYDGETTPSVTTLTDAEMRNCQVPFSVIANASVQRSTGVFRVTKPRFIVLVKNNGALSITGLVVSYRKLNYESV